MQTNRRNLVILFCIAMLALTWSCAFGSPAPTPTAVPVAQQPQPTVDPSLLGEVGNFNAPGAPRPTGQLALTLPDDRQVILQINCQGLDAGKLLDIRATNTQDVNDPTRLEVHVGGQHTSTSGQFSNLYVMVAIGAKNKWEFMGNSAVATVALDGKTGLFTNVAIVNTAGSATYQANQEYNFSATWDCLE